MDRVIEIIPLLMPAILYFLAGIFASDRSKRFNHTNVLMSLGLITSLVLLTLSLVNGTGSSPVTFSLVTKNQLFTGTFFNLMLLSLVSLLGVVVVRYMTTYLRADRRRSLVIRWSCFTIATVSGFMTSNHLGIFLIAWIACSACLNKIILLYAERPNVAGAFRLKYLLSRLAEILILAASILLISQYGSLNLDILYQQVVNLSLTSMLPWVLITLAVLLKSAQLPVHGWLLTMIELPTPVSALLHAGIINLGGFLILRLSPIMENIWLPQILMISAGGITALIASLIMRAQTTIKARLAWSTSSQMGFLLLECGLGLYAFAVLHMMAHSVYKANAFLNSGTISQPVVVKDTKQSEIWITTIVGISFITLQASLSLSYYFPLLISALFILIATYLYRHSKFESKLLKQSLVRNSFMLILTGGVLHYLIGGSALLNLSIPVTHNQLPKLMIYVVMFSIVAGYLALVRFKSRTNQYHIYHGFFIDKFIDITLEKMLLHIPGLHKALNRKIMVSQYRLEEKNI